MLRSVRKTCASATGMHNFFGRRRRGGGSADERKEQSPEISRRMPKINEMRYVDAPPSSSISFDDEAIGSQHISGVRSVPAFRGRREGREGRHSRDLSPAEVRARSWRRMAGHVLGERAGRSRRPTRHELSQVRSLSWEPLSGHDRRRSEPIQRTRFREPRRRRGGSGGGGDGGGDGGGGDGVGVGGGGRAPPPAGGAEAPAAGALVQERGGRRSTHSRRSRLFPSVQDFEKLYVMLRKLAQGSEGEIFEAVDRDSGEHVVVKVVPEDPASSHAARLHLGLRSEYIVKLRGVFQGNRLVYMVMEQCACDLYDYLKKHGPLQEDLARQATRHLLKALAAMHKRNIGHFDVRPENVLLMSKRGMSFRRIVKYGLFEELRFKLCDFGTARVVQPGSRGVRERLGTLGYVAPEVLSVHQGRPYGLEADLWSLGATLFAMLCGDGLFPEDMDSIEVLHRSMNHEVDFRQDAWAGVSDEAKDFIFVLLDPQPVRRLKAKEALNHPWITRPSIAARSKVRQQRRRRRPAGRAA